MDIPDFRAYARQSLFSGFARKVNTYRHVRTAVLNYSMLIFNAKGGGKQVGAPPQRITLTKDDREALQRIVDCATTPPAIVKRAKILLLKEKGMTNVEIADELDTHCDVVGQWVRRYISRPEEYDMDGLLSMAKGSGRRRQITDDDIAWMREQYEKRKSVDGSISSFRRYIMREAENAGHPRLATIASSTTRDIVNLFRNQL